MRLLLAPHAETAWNAEGRFQGHTDIPLNERGRRQRTFFKNTWRRSRSTSSWPAICAGQWRRRKSSRCRTDCVSRPIRISRELNFGDWEGLTYAEIQERDAQTLAEWENEPLHKSPPQGERLTSVAQRLQEFLHDLENHHTKDSTLLLVAHRGSLRVLLCLLLGRPVERHWEFRLDPATVSEVTMAAGRAELLRLNEIPHACEVGHGC